MFDCILEHSSNVSEDIDNHDLFYSIHMPLEQSNLKEIQSRAIAHQRFSSATAMQRTPLSNSGSNDPPEMSKWRQETQADRLSEPLQNEFIYSYEELNCPITVRLPSPRNQSTSRNIQKELNNQSVKQNSISWFPLSPSKHGNKSNLLNAPLHYSQRP